MAWQFDHPEAAKGYVQVFRRPGCEDSNKTLELKGLKASAQYELTDLDARTTRKVSGSELMEKGLAVEIKDKPGSALFVYQRMK